MTGTPDGDADPLAEVRGWGTPFAAAGVRSDGRTAVVGDTAHVVRIASVTKLLTAWAVLVAVEEGAVTLADPVGQPGCTLGLLLCHAGGYDFDTARTVAAPATRRIYSNTGYELAAGHVEDVTGIEFVDYLAEAVLEPLGMTSSTLRGSPAADLWSSVDDLLRFAVELQSPTLLDASTATEFRTVQLPDLAGVLPGWGRFDPLPWGLGPEVRGTKEPSWMGTTAPAGCVGHFGGTGTLLWADPLGGTAVVALTDHEFGDWAVAAWPSWSDRVRAAYS
ncbi:MAG: serine hydrolase domain-containing protein [Actinomycetes bacterium]